MYLFCYTGGHLQEREFTLPEAIETCLLVTCHILCFDRQEVEEIQGIALILGSDVKIEMYHDYVDRSFLGRHQSPPVFLRLPYTVFTTRHTNVKVL